MSKAGPTARRAGWVLALAFLAPAPPSLVAQEDSTGRDAVERRFGDVPDPAEGSAEGQPRPLDPVFRAIDPARLQRGLDRFFGVEEGETSRRPKAPEIGEPVFFDTVRPFGDLKFGNELNYLYNPGLGSIPTLAVIEYEYVFADWRSVELDLSYYDGNFQVLTPFYQRTLGVGPRGNWVHGYQLSLDIYTRSGFLGGSPVYSFGWKPEAESKFGILTFAGASRMLIGGFNFPRAGPSGLVAPPMPVQSGDRVYGAWRPTFNVDLFYNLTEKFTLGIENDLFFGNGRAGEYLIFPFVTYKPGDHAFFQFGGGYYHFESRDEFTFFTHVNITNPSQRKPKERAEADVPARDVDEPGNRLRRCLDRLMGGR